MFGLGSALGALFGHGGGGNGQMMTGSATSAGMGGKMSLGQLMASLRNQYQQQQGQGFNQSGPATQMTDRGPYARQMPPWFGGMRGGVQRRLGDLYGGGGMMYPGGSKNFNENPYGSSGQVPISPGGSMPPGERWPMDPNGQQGGQTYEDAVRNGGGGIFYPPGGKWDMSQLQPAMGSFMRQGWSQEAQDWKPGQPAPEGYHQWSDFRNPNATPSLYSNDMMHLM